MQSLLLGCGRSRAKKVKTLGQSDWAGQLVSLDMNPDVEPTVVWDLENLPLPWDNEAFDELAAYDVLEHFGRQGDWRRWFDECAEYWRILKPGGEFGIIVPINGDALADPGHTRFFSANYFTFLSQKWIADQLAIGKQITDYRFYWKKNFDVIHLENVGNHHLGVILRKA